MEIRPRGLVNTGNMCFANVVLQVLVYSPPFWRVFTELGKYIGNGPVVGSGAEKDGKGTPLTDAMITFLGEFKLPKPSEIAERAQAMKDGEKPDSRRDSFVPSSFYAALKTKSRFDAMRSGHQEDAEEFLGFLLDTLHEELLTLNTQFGGKNEAAGPASSKVSSSADDTASVTDSDVAVDDEWQEVGKKNRAMVTRTVSASLHRFIRCGIDMLGRLRPQSRLLLPSLVASSDHCFERLEGPTRHQWNNGVVCNWIFRFVGFFDTFECLVNARSSLPMSIPSRTPCTISARQRQSRSKHDTAHRPKQPSRCSSSLFRLC